MISKNSWQTKEKNARFRAQRAAKTAEEKLVWREKRNEKDRVRRRAKNNNYKQL